MKYFKLPTENKYTCSFSIGDVVYNATVKTLSTSLKKIWSVRDTEGNEIFKNLYMSTGVNYASMFVQFASGSTLKIIESGGNTYLATE